MYCQDPNTKVTPDAKFSRSMTTSSTSSTGSAPVPKSLLPDLEAAGPYKLSFYGKPETNML